MYDVNRLIVLIRWEKVLTAAAANFKEKCWDSKSLSVYLMIYSPIPEKVQWVGNATES